MKLKPRDLIFMAIVIFVVGGLWWLSTRNKAKAMLPNPPEHLTAKSRNECLQCHLPEKLAELELQHKHPGKWRDERVECTRCHKPPREANAQNPTDSQTGLSSYRAALISAKLTPCAAHRRLRLGW